MSHCVPFWSIKGVGFWCRWCLDIAKAGLEERVVSLAMALVQAEGFAEQLDVKCKEQEALITKLQAQLNSQRQLHRARSAINTPNRNYMQQRRF
jgi:hypothetical protein